MPEQRVEYRVCGAHGGTLSVYHDGQDDPLGHARRMAAFLDKPNQVSSDCPHRVERRIVTTTPWEKVEE